MSYREIKVSTLKFACFIPTVHTPHRLNKSPKCMQSHASMKEAFITQPTVTYSARRARVDTDQSRFVAVSH